VICSRNTAPQKTLFTGDVVIQAFSIQPGQDGRLRADRRASSRKRLSKSEAPEAKEQLAGWKVIKNAMPNPDGTIVYIHVISRS
jgi:hypothetical protein